MKQLMKLAAAAALGAAAAGSIVYAQAPAAEPPEVIVSIYRAAPGQQMGLLQWLAAQDQGLQAAGVAPGQLYIHTNGDSWDYVSIGAATTSQQDETIEAARRKLGLPVGARNGMELRKYIASHTDTYAIGPVTAAQTLQEMQR